MTPDGLPEYSAADDTFLALVMVSHVSHVSPTSVVYRAPVAQKSVDVGRVIVGCGMEVRLVWPHLVCE